MAPFVAVRAATGFLTRLPVGHTAGEREATGAAAFGLVGAAIGGTASLPVVLLGERLPLPAAVLALLIVVVATGGLHVDGLADTADALAAPTADAAERARTDPRAGAAGVIAIVLDLFLAAALLAALTAVDVRLAAVGLIVAATGSRAAAPLAAWTSRHAGNRGVGGLGDWFAERVGPGSVVAGIVTTTLAVALAAAALGGPVVAVGVAAGLVVAAAASGIVIARRGQLDGDGYGAIVEIAFLAILAGIAVAATAP
jgi:adenosylcobinamide-GDP ribazoletransferase